MRSLRRLLLVALLLTIGVAAAISTMLSYAASHNETNELFDAKLAQSARVLQALVGHRLDQMYADADPVVVSVLDIEIEGDGGPDSVFGDPEIHAFARDWVRKWGIDPDPDAADQSVNYRVMLCEAVAAPGGE